MEKGKWVGESLILGKRTTSPRFRMFGSVILDTRDAPPPISQVAKGEFLDCRAYKGFIISDNYRGYTGELCKGEISHRAESENL